MDDYPESLENEEITLWTCTQALFMLIFLWCAVVVSGEKW